MGMYGTLRRVTVTDAERLRADPRLLEIYPEIWDRPEETDEPRGFLLNAFAELRELVANAARDGDAIVVCIS